MCAVMYAELAYLMEGPPAEDALKKLRKESVQWRDPASDVLDCEDASILVSACEKVCHPPRSRSAITAQHWDAGVKTAQLAPGVCTHITVSHEG